MRILHVSLGLPPLRTGGLVRYCTDLMEAQATAGDDVSLLFPGRYLPGPMRIRRGFWHGVETCELINPLPVALTYGVAEPAAFTVPCPDPGALEDLLSSFAPDVIHIHSYMGIYREFFQIAKSLGIPMVFTTHDYYPLCPRCTFIDSSGFDCATGASSRSCSACCRGGMTLRKCAVMQSGPYAAFKASGLFDKIVPVVKRLMSSKARRSQADPAGGAEAESYQLLLNYNRSVFELFDLVLANSTTAEAMYRSACPAMAYRSMLISHAGLSVNSAPRRSRNAGDPLIVGYFGGEKEYKGIDTLTDAARILHEKGAGFELRLYGDDYGNLGVPEARSCGRFAPELARGILRGFDVVAFPSKCHETFGFVVLEALCEGIPVVCSNVVGASDLVRSDCVFPAGDAEALAGILLRFCIEGAESSCLPHDYPLSMVEQACRIKDCYLLLQRKSVDW